MSKIETKKKFGIATLCSFGVILVLAVGVLAGMYAQELMGYVLFSALIATVIADAGVIASYFVVSIKEYRVAVITWLVMAVAIPIISFAIVGPVAQQAESEIGMLIGYPMAFLSFPLGVVASMFLSISPLRPTTFYAGNLFDWSVFLVAGIVQWFWLGKVLASRVKYRWAKRIKSND